MPLDRAQAKLEEIERDLKKCADFQYYLIAKSRKDRARMKRVLMEIPAFRLWRTLTVAVRRAHRRPIRDKYSTAATSLQSTARESGGVDMAMPTDLVRPGAAAH